MTDSDKKGAAPDDPTRPVEQTIELAGPPLFEVGERVRALRDVRNDGTFYGSRIGEFLITVGDVGYVHSVGEYLNRYYIYAVDFYERGRLVGMRGHEIEAVDR